MAIKLATGMRNWLLSGGSWKGALDGGLLYIYDGSAPAGPDDALSGNTLLCTISLTGGGSGIHFDAAASGGVLAKAPAETWQGTNVASGTASFFRFVESGGDPSAASATEKRIQGSVAVAGADLNLSSVSLVNGATQTVDFFNVTQPSG